LENRTGIPRWKYSLKTGGLYAIGFFFNMGIDWINKEAAFSLKLVLINAGIAILLGLAITSSMWHSDRKEYKNLLRKKGDEKWKTIA